MSSLPELEIELGQLLPLIQEKLSAGKTVCFSPMGTSMLPMLRQRIDKVVLSAPPDQLKKYDLPLYRRDNGKFILHRVIRAGEALTCCGDNQFEAESGIRPDQVIALVTGFYRGQRFHSVRELPYRLYCALWHHSRPLRHFYRRARGWLSRHLYPGR